MQCAKIKLCPTPFLNHFILHRPLPIAKLIFLSLRFFHLKNFHPYFLKKINFCGTDCDFLSETTNHCVFQSHTQQYGYETS